MRWHIAGCVVLAVVLGAVFYATRDSTPADDSPLAAANSFTHAHGMSVDVADATKVYIATHEGLYVLQNDSELFRIGNARDDLMGFSSHPTDPKTFFSSGHPARGGNIGFQKTTDGGISWQRLSTGLGGPVDFHAMTVSAANPEVAYGFYGGKLQRTTDGGKSWQYTKGSVAPISLTTHPERPEVVYASTQSGVQVSQDQGNSWKNLSTQLEGGAVSVFALNPSEPTTALVFSERINGLGRSTDGGVTWQRVNESFGGRPVLYLSFSRTEPDIAYALTDSNNVYKSTDGGGSWARVR